MSLGTLLERFFNSLMWGIILALNASTISVSTGVIGAFLGGILGFWLSYKLSSSRLRIPVFVLGALLLDRTLVWIAEIPINSSFVSSLFLSPERASIFSQGLVWFINSALLVMTIHAISVRRPWFVAVELIIVANIALLPLSAHRDGFISRPYFFVDPLWSRGWSPVPFFIAAGVILAIALVFLIVGRFTKRTIIDLSILVVIISLVGIFLPLKDLRQPLPEQIISGEAKGDEQQEVKGKQGGNDSRDKQSDNKDQNNNQQPNNSDNQDKNQNDQQNQQNQNNSGNQNDSNGNDQDQNNDKNSNNNDKNDDKNNSSSNSKPKPVAVVVFNDDYTPPEGYYYFRQDAKSFFNGRKLVADISGRYDHDIASAFPQVNSANPLTPPQVSVEQTKAVSTNINLIAEHNQPFGLLNPLLMQAAPNPNSSQFIGAYSVLSRSFSGKLETLMQAKLNNPRWSKTDIEYYTKLPDDKRYRELALNIQNDIPESFKDLPMAKVYALKLWLDKNSTYDTRVRITDNDDVVSKYLFGDRVGYCVHNANALAYLCRSIGIPARVAEGYAIDARNTYGGSSLLIMNNNGHSWCEVYVQGLGWYPIDVSPERSNVTPPEPPDADLQKMFGEMAREKSQNEDDIRQQPADMQMQMRSLVKAFGWLMLILAVVAFIGAWVHKIYIHLMAHLSSGSKRADCTYKAALVSLAEIGLRRRYGETREEFAERLAPQVPTLQTLTQGHIRCNLGESPETGFTSRTAIPTTAECAASYSAFKSELSSCAPWWRRMLGIVNPFAWLFVR
ncbi:MAG: transglutaminase domain-containing protein [Candidatus Bruticola sp.]